VFHVVVLHTVAHAALGHLERHHMYLVLVGVDVCLEGYVMPFVALDCIGITYRPGLVVLVAVNIFPSSLILPVTLMAFFDASSDFMLSCPMLPPD
jgi:hypothetical protein